MNTQGWTRAAGVVAAVLAMVASERRAHAQSAADVAERHRLLEQIATAVTAGDHARALDLARRAASIRTTPSLRVILAEEARATSGFAEALNEGTLCLAEAARDPALADRALILSRCEAVVTAVAPRVGRITVRVPTPAPPDLRITVAGQPLHAAFYDQPYVVTPGTVVVEATAEGQRADHQAVTIAAGMTAEVRLALAPHPAAALDRAVRSSAAAPVRSDAPGAGGPGPGPWIVGGLGLASLGASVVAFLARNSAYDALVAGCDHPAGSNGYWCVESPASRARLANVDLLNTTTNATLIAGPVLMGAGVLWYVLARPSAARPERGQARVRPAFGAMMLGAEGTF